MLKVENLCTSYGHVQVLKNVSLEVGDGEFITIIGANGAGKTTLLAAISRLVGTGGGRIFLNGRDITRCGPERVVRLGIGQVPAGRQLFPDMSVMDNLRLGAYTRRRDKKAVADDLDRVFSIFPVLGERKDQNAGTLSGGEQQMLAVGRTLMSKPRLVLLDEPSMGLAPLVIRDIFNVLLDLHKEGLTILLVEQDARLALSLADRGYVLQSGEVVLSDTGKRLLANPEVQEIYFGKRVEKQA